MFHYGNPGRRLSWRDGEARGLATEARAASTEARAAFVRVLDLGSCRWRRLFRSKRPGSAPAPTP